MVKTGYKQTEIGILPDAWDTITFENCFTILSLSKNASSRYARAGVLVVSKKK